MRTMPELSAEAQKLEDRLALVPVGETVTYAELSALIERDVQSIGRGALNTARRRLHRRASAVFLPVRKVGLVNATDAQKCDVGADLSPIRRAVRRKSRVLAAVTMYDQLPEPQKVKHNTGLAVCGAFDLMLKPSEQRRVAAAVTTTQRRLNVEETIRLFS